MKKVFKFLVSALVLFGLVGGCLIAYVVTMLPRVKPAQVALKIEVTPQRVARGRYLAQSVAVCMGCHSQRDWTTYGHPTVPGTFGAGGDPVFERPLMPGSVRPPNLTPYHLKDWSDGEIVRAIRVGVSKDGRPLFPFMPYENFRHMTQEDLYSVVAYLRTLPEVKNDVSPTRLDPPLNVLVHLMPSEAPDYPQSVDPKDTVAYGAYLAKIAGCADCHTPVDRQNKPLPGMAFAGGREFRYFRSKPGGYEAHPGGGVLRVPNITPDEETGIGRWTKGQFIARFAEWRGKNAVTKHRRLNLDKGDYVSMMPYGEYAGMTDADLGAIYDYLRTQPKVKNRVVRFEAPKL